MASPLLLFLSTLISFVVSSTAAADIIIPLSPFSNRHGVSSSPNQIIASLAASSIARAQYLKHRKTISNTTTHDELYASSRIKTPLFPHSYGAYSIDLSFGTPPQTTSFVMDTGSSLVWFPCTSSYLCSSCNFSGTDPSKIPTFMPKNSSSSKLLDCKNPKCSWLFGADVDCPKCDSTKPNCTQSCPPYELSYGQGSTLGLLLIENLDFKEKLFIDFIVGCSIKSTQQPATAGIAGFGRGPESLPSQLNLKKFSYCLVSRNFDDTQVSSDMVLETESDKRKPNVSYTPLRENHNSSNPAFHEYYYVILSKILVGDTHVKVPYKYLVPGLEGNGGTIVDSGSTFTFMEKPIFDLVSNKFIKQMGKLNISRSTEVEDLTGMSPCFNVSGHEDANPPSLVFKFKGGAKMELPMSNYIMFAGDGAVCLAVVSDSGLGKSVGPSIILGNFQQQNYYIEYDLGHKKFGFKRQTCAQK